MLWFSEIQNSIFLWWFLVICDLYSQKEWAYEINIWFSSSNTQFYVWILFSPFFHQYYDFFFHLLKTDRYCERDRWKQSSKIISSLYCIYWLSSCVRFYFPFYIYKVNFWLNMSSCHADVSKLPLTNWWIYYHHCYSFTFVVFMPITVS